MTTFREETLSIVENLQSEDIKFLNLLERLSFEKIMSFLPSEMTKEKVQNFVRNTTTEDALNQKDDNIDIIQKLAFLENPFMKEAGFKEFYNKAISRSYKSATYDNVYTKDVIDGSINLNNGTYKNIFNGLKVRIEKGERSLAILPKKTDRNKKLIEDKITLGDILFLPDDQSLSSFYNQSQIDDIKKQFTLYHEMAHLTGSQLLSLQVEGAFTRLTILHETHSDICGAIKTIQDNKMDKEQAVALINDVIYARSNYGHISDSLCRDDGTEYTEHLTHVGLFTLRDFVNHDVNYLHTLKNEEISKFSTLMTEQAHQPSNINRLEKSMSLFPNDKEALKDMLHAEMADGNSFLARMLSHNQKLNKNVDVVEYTANKIANDPYIRLDLSFRTLRLFDPKKLMEESSPYSSVINLTLKEDFEFFKKEYKENNVQLSKCFDYKELQEKTKQFKVKAWF